MAGDKEEFAPLFAPGRPLMTISELAHLCVDPFPTSSSRPRLLQRLSALIAALDETVGRCDVWVDGSFVSEKQEPGDIDLTVVVEGDVLNGLGAAEQIELGALLTDQRFGPDLHVFGAIRWPIGHPNFADANQLLRTMSEWWSVARRGWLKGMPVIRLGETDVGLRILS